MKKEIINAEIRIPTTQYGYVNINVGVTKSNDGINTLMKLHNQAIQAYQDSLKTPSVEPEITTGLNVKDWQRVLDTYMVEGSIQEEDLSAMSDKQKGLINEIKKSINRIKSRQE